MARYLDRPLNFKWHAYDCIREMLANGEIAAGTQVSDARIAKQIGTSRTPVREAILQLANEGLLEQIPQRGTYVKQLSRADVNELWELRSMIERFAVRRAARRHRPRRLLRLRRSCARQHELVEKLKKAKSAQAFARLDAAWKREHLSFHRLLIQESRNRRMIKIAEDSHILANLCDQHVKLPQELAINRFVVAIKFHRSIVKAIGEGDVAEADRLMRQHMRNGWRTQVQAIAKREASDVEPSST